MNEYQARNARKDKFRMHREQQLQANNLLIIFRFLLREGIKRHTDGTQYGATENRRVEVRGKGGKGSRRRGKRTSFSSAAAFAATVSSAAFASAASSSSLSPRVPRTVDHSKPAGGASDEMNAWSASTSAAAVVAATYICSNLIVS